MGEHGSFSLRRCAQIGPEAHPGSCPIETGVSSLWVNRLGHETNLCPSTNAQSRNAWSYTSTPSIIFILGKIGWETGTSAILYEHVITVKSSGKIQSNTCSVISKETYCPFTFIFVRFFLQSSASTAGNGRIHMSRESPLKKETPV